MEISSIASGGGAGASSSKSGGYSGDATFSVPWVEKYRPNTVEEITGNEATVARLKVIAKQGNLQNCLIAGPPGTGKTTSILCLARALLGDAFAEGVLELNASDERSIDVVRNTIKRFAQKKVTLPPGRHKIIILDEADSMTTGAQQALRRTMELHSATTRFALACNDSTKIIEPIQSRCAILRYARLTDQQVLDRLLQIIKAEGVESTNEGLEALVFTADGDMRQAINNLESTVAGFGMVTPDHVFKVCDQPHPVVVKAMIAAVRQGDLLAANARLETLWYQGYSGSDIIGTIFKIVKSYPDLSEMHKLNMIKEIGITHTRFTDGVVSLLQLAGLLGRMIDCLRE
ncbi:replication factor C subunit 4 [Thecamonas trahens ATCC 50062]|uniref:Replication factor C subunit 4 n=1 Tax=Thecamonas trahens ATCC 50062 TaxID=461836 RepID=A0A0L0DEX1_THETB|nr:replication factor C subunit 4 [Thecamonas trahens ATCC 50062]KNC49868.1 replication factor C subunit 4 [Thecamonas trahens ATCC 50062]|eukprot:XP_013757352.1 replication factor C subunit 4 [Thecamonas trahens ATCC 50062]